MAHTPTQAKKIAAQIMDQLGQRISYASNAHYMDTAFLVPESFLAGLIGVEAGRDRNGKIVETSTRYEPHVYRKLRDVKDGRLNSYSNIRRAQIQDAGEAALKALATSYGVTQIMGWWALHLDTTVAEIRDPETHLGYAIKLLEKNAGKYIKTGNYAAALRIWNTGKPNGKTHDPSYVANALAVKTAYEVLGS